VPIVCAGADNGRRRMYFIIREGDRLLRAWVYSIRRKQTRLSFLFGSRMVRDLSFMQVSAHGRDVTRTDNTTRRLNACDHIDVSGVPPHFD
jgi:hypothetical protein